MYVPYSRSLTLCATKISNSDSSSSSLNNEASKSCRIIILPFMYEAPICSSCSWDLPRAMNIGSECVCEMGTEPNGISPFTHLRHSYPLPHRTSTFG